MKKLLFAAAIACLAIFSSCDKQGVIHTGDVSGNLYGVWALSTKTEVYQSGSSENEKTEKTTDYSKVHFYLALGEFPFPHAIAKKGSFSDIDLDDVDVDAVMFSFNADQKKISFSKRLWLSDELLSYNMILDGTFDVLELTEERFVIQQTSNLLGTTTYSFTRYK